MELSSGSWPGALELQQALASGEISAAEVTAEALRRAGAAENPSSGPPLGAFVHLESSADDVTRMLDELPAASRQRWHGLPMALKDLQEVRGQPTTQGSRVLAPEGPESAPVARDDDETAALHRTLGAVLLAKTQVPEFGLNCYSENLVGASARNPWDLQCNAGGSSGGQAAAVAARVLPVAVGSDGGGSIRIPAAACGLIGLKPGRGTVPTGDAMSDHGMLAVQGPIARTALDAALVLDGLTQPVEGAAGGNRLFRSVASPGAAAARDPWGPSSPPSSSTSPAGAEALRGPAVRTVLRARDGDLPWGRRTLQVGVTTASPFEAAHPTPVSPQAQEALDDGLEALRAAGHHCQDADVRYDPAYPEAFFDLWTTGVGAAPLQPEQEQRLTGLAKNYRTRAQRRSAVELAVAIRTLRDMERTLLREWDRWDVLVTPALAQTPRPLGWWWEGFDPADPASADQDYERQCRYTPYTSLINVIGLPAIVVPTALVRSEVTGAVVPMGVQLIGRPGAELGLLALAEQITGTLDPDVRARLAAPPRRG